MTQNSNIFDEMSVGELKTCRHVIQVTIGLLAPTDEVRKAVGEFGIFLGSAADDTGMNEIRMFRTLRNELASQVDKTVKGGPAITKFVTQGIKVDGGKLKGYDKALGELHKSLSKSLGPAVGKQVADDVALIVNNQWLASKAVMSKSIAQAGRAIDKGITQVDRGVLNVLNTQNNFFIGNTYNAALVDTVNKTTANLVEKGAPRRALDVALRKELGSALPKAGDDYYRVLAGDVLNRARTYSQVNSYAEARIRKYEILAVLDERTSVICEHMDGRIFEVEIARKIIKDTTTFGVPGSASDQNKFKALRPWIYFQDPKKAGDNTLFYRGPKGEKIFLPGSAVSGDSRDNFKPIGVKNEQTTREIIDTTPKGGNPPQLPPFHAHCRTTTIVDEQDVRTQNFSEAVSKAPVSPRPKVPIISPATYNKEYTKWSKGLTTSERDAINLWEEDIFMAKDVRVFTSDIGAKGVEFNTVKEVKEIAKQMEKAFAKAPKFEGTIFRGMRLEAKQAKAFKKGTEFELGGLSSWSKKEVTAQYFTSSEFIIEEGIPTIRSYFDPSIVLKVKTKKGVDIAGTIKNPGSAILPDQAEVIVPTGKYKVIKTRTVNWRSEFGEAHKYKEVTLEEIG